MLELYDGKWLDFSFPELGEDVQLSISFKRTIRVPDDGNEYPLPAGLGSFPIRHIEDHSSKLPNSWKRRGGVMLPMHDNEALWISFTSSYIDDRRQSYPFAVMIGTGKINAVSGLSWESNLNDINQNYVVSPEQPWIDGYRVGNGVVRQFVSSPLGSGITVEEQLTGKDEYGGIQIQVFPMKIDTFRARFPILPQEEEERPQIMYSRKIGSGLGAGGLIKQKIYPDPFGINDWDQNLTSRVFVHLLNADIWKEVTGEYPPKKPAGAWIMNEEGIPWFNLDDDDSEELGDTGSPFSNVSSVGKFMSNKTSWIFENIGFKPKKTVQLTKNVTVKETGDW